MLTVKPVYKHLNVSDDLKWTDGSLPKAMPVYNVLFPVFHTSESYDSFCIWC